MKLAIIVLGAALSLSACQTKPIEQMSYTEVKALAGEIQKRCYAQGVKPNSREYDMCIRQEISREQSTRVANRQRQIAFGEAMSEAGANMQRNAAMNRPVNCTSSRGYGTTINTTCY
ncbi:hypothetical protein HWX16_23150 [Ochrobactrum intermedium]|uniref:hypothetical protein n=1 Tax=Brucella intermedia TaxID=94625 RepID=UPI00159C8362|nr:hypothetical protein [Brucella intermedia]NVM43185.1 hypothetical protein [Brucella intermedia]